MQELGYDVQQQQTPFPHQKAGEDDLWESKSGAKAGTVWFLQINYLGELCQKDVEPKEHCSVAMAEVGRRTHDELKMVRRLRKEQAVHGTGGTNSWFDCSFKVCDH